MGADFSGIEGLNIYSYINYDFVFKGYLDTLGSINLVKELFLFEDSSGDKGRVGSFLVFMPDKL
jgi:hypothetical protein